MRSETLFQSFNDKVQIEKNKIKKKVAISDYRIKRIVYNKQKVEQRHTKSRGIENVFTYWIACWLHVRHPNLKDHY